MRDAGREAVKSLPERTVEPAQAKWLYIGWERLPAGGGIAGPAVMVGFGARSTGETQAVRPVMGALPAEAPSRLVRARSARVRAAVAAGTPTHTSRGAHGRGPIPSEGCQCVITARYSPLSLSP